MGKLFGSVVGAVSLLVTIGLSPYVVDWVDSFVGHFPVARWWLWPTTWLAVASGAFLLCFGAAVGWDRVERQRRLRKEKAEWQEVLRKHDDLARFVQQLSKQISRFHKELSQESSPDDEALNQYLEADDMCFRMLELTRYGPTASLQRLPIAYDPERELLDIAIQHYEVELRYELRATGKTVRQRVGAATFGAKCIDLLASRLGRVLANKRTELSTSGGYREDKA